MLSEAEKLQQRANQCRALAKSNLDPAAEDRLLALAEELEARAQQLEDEPAKH